MRIFGTPQKVRVLRRVARQLAQEESAIGEDLDAFYAPSECWPLAMRPLRRRAARVMERLGLSLDEFRDEINRYTPIEAPFAVYDGPEGHWEGAPPAYYEYLEIASLVDPD